MFTKLSWAYIGFISAWLILRSLFFDRLWWIALLNYVAIYLFIPLPVLLIISIWQRCWRLLCGLSVPLVAFILIYGSLFTPSLENPSHEQGQSFTVMSFNVQLGNLDFLPLAQAIQSANPDIVGLQEVIPELATNLVQELSQDFPYNTLIPGNSESIEFVGILSRFPIRQKSSIPLPGVRYRIDPKTQIESIEPGPRLGIRATIQIGEQTLQVVSVDGIHNPTFNHPIAQWAAIATDHYTQKAEEIWQLEQQLRQTGEPFLLLCDCNLVETSEAYANLARFANDSFREAGWGLGHTKLSQIGPIAAPVGQRIDYIWHSKELITLKTWVGSNGGSDHLPVIAKLKLVG
jgi:endonuclease/exonuclease/phosphatase (EEP) superfamily protein YafD